MSRLSVIPSRQDALLNLVSGKNRGVPAQLARAGLWALTPLYGLGIGAYRGMYDAGLLREVRLPLPVVGIGNLTVGGTGKTGMVLALAGRLRQSGYRPALLNYGYRAGHGKGPAVVSDGEACRLTPEEAGDEAALLARSLPGVPVLIGKRRVESGRLAIEQFQPDLLLLDDAFQYWRLFKDLEIVLLDAIEPWGYGALLPRGLLRESPAVLRHADAVVLTHTRGVSWRRMERLRNEVRRIAPPMPIFEANYHPTVLHPLEGGDALDRERWPDGPLGVLTALGNPARFEESIAAAGGDPRVPYRFPDHHPYRAEEIVPVAEDAKARGLAALLTTAKDAVKLRALALGDLPVPILVLEAELRVEPAETFDAWFEGRLKGVSPQKRG